MIHSIRSLFPILITTFLCLLIHIPWVVAFTAESTPFVQLIKTYDLPKIGVKSDIALFEEGKKVYVADPDNSRVLKYQEDGQKFTIFKIKFSKSLFYPQSICLDCSGHLWTVNPYMHEVLQINNKGSLVRSYKKPDISFARPTEISCLRNLIAIFDQEKSSLFFLDQSDGVLLRHSPTKTPNKLTAYRLTSQSEGKFILLDSDLSELHIFRERSGQDLVPLKSKNNDQTFYQDLCAGPDDTLFICSTAPPSIGLYSLSGQQLRRFFLSEPYLEHPTAIAYGADEVWMVDSGKESVIRFKLRQAESGIEHSVLGEEYLIFDLPHHAVKEFEKALSLGYESFDMHLAWGKALYALEEYESALNHFKKTSKIRPDSFGPTIWSARCYQALGAIEKAIVNYIQTLQKDPGNQHIFYGLGVIYLQKHRLQEAQKYLKKSIDLNPNFNSAHIALGRVYFEKNDYARAEKHFSSLTQSESVELRNRAKYYLGLVALQKGDFIRAVNYLRHNTKVGPFFSDAFYALGLAYIGLNEKDKAIKSYQQALEISPGHQKAKQALQKAR